MQVEQLARILAITQAKSREFSQVWRASSLLENGVEETFACLYPGLILEDDLLSPYVETIQSWYGQGYKFLTLLDDEYPTRLRNAYDCPIWLFYQGDLEITKHPSISIVGSRKPTAEDERKAFNTAFRLSREGYTIVSGLAEGIDTQAHKGALAADGLTVAVMGTGIDQTYPAKNISLREEIVGSNGLVLTQFVPGFSPSKKSFPMRNVTMSGLSDITIVIAAGEYSGTRHQTYRALKHGRLVFLTDTVVENTKWGRELSEKPGVFVVSGLPQILEKLKHLKDLDRKVKELCNVA